MNNGGPAFPPNDMREGMSLRDYFAASSDIPWSAVFETLSIKHPDRNGQFTVKELLEYRCELKFLEADIMLEKRATKTTK